LNVPRNAPAGEPFVRHAFLVFALPGTPRDSGAATVPVIATVPQELYQKVSGIAK
jgi:hypothetical protein